MTETSETAIAVRTEQTQELGFLRLDDLKTAFEAAKMFAASTLVPKAYQGKPADVIVAWQAGAELGVTPMQSLQGFVVLQGRLTQYVEFQKAIVLASHDCEDIADSYDAATETCTVTIKRRSKRTPTTRSFSRANAERAGLWGKPGPWTQYPETMLYNRAMGFALRHAFPDLLRGFKSTEEVGDYQPIPHDDDPVPPSSPPQMPEPDTAPRQSNGEALAAVLVAIAEATDGYALAGVLAMDEAQELGDEDRRKARHAYDLRAKALQAQMREPGADG